MAHLQEQFINELENQIFLETEVTDESVNITMSGPTSTMEMTLTRMEVDYLRQHLAALLKR